MSKESPRAPIRIDYIIHATVAFADAEWVRFDGSQERMFFGEGHGFVKDQKVKITFEKEPS